MLSIRQRLRAHQTARHQEGDERETGDEKWISLQAERIFVTESKSLSGGKRASHWALIKGGMKAAWPICIGYIPLGFAFGVLAQKGGLSVLDIAIMSVVVFAGSSQFIAEGSFGIGYALSAMFLCLIVFQLQGRIYALTALITGCLAIAASLLLPGDSFICLMCRLPSSFHTPPRPPQSPPRPLPGRDS